MILIADAAPVIFLAKIERLALIGNLFDAQVLVPAIVEEELVGGVIPPDEERLLTAFLATCRIIEVADPDIHAKSLSLADNSVLTLAKNEHADWVLSDDRLLRRVAAMDGLRTIGTLGILIRAAKQNLISADAAGNMIDLLVRKHNFRISIEVYAAARNALDTIRGDGSK